MLLRNKRIIERPNRLIIAAKSVNMNVHDVNNVEMAMIDDTASPNVNKSVGPSAEIGKEHGQNIESREFSENYIQNLGPGSQEVVQTDNVGAREEEVEKQVEKETENQSQESGRMGQDPLHLIMSMLAGLEQNIKQKLSNNKQ